MDSVIQSLAEGRLGEAVVQRAFTALDPAHQAALVVRVLPEACDAAPLVSFLSRLPPTVASAALIYRALAVEPFSVPLAIATLEGYSGLCAAGRELLRLLRAYNCVLEVLFMLGDEAAARPASPGSSFAPSSDSLPSALSPGAPRELWKRLSLRDFARGNWLTERIPAPEDRRRVAEAVLRTRGVLFSSAEYAECARAVLPPLSLEDVPEEDSLLGAVVERLRSCA